MALISRGSIGDILPEAGIENQPSELAGITLKSIKIKDIREPFWENSAEVYMFGVAIDARNEVIVIPFGQAELADTKLSLEKVDEGQTIEFLGSGLPLVLPPVTGFLALRLLVVDSDQKAREAAEVIKTAAEVAGDPITLSALAAAGLAQAAVITLLLSKTLESASSALANNRDDIIETFAGFFTAAELIPGNSVSAINDGAEATFEFV